MFLANLCGGKKKKSQKCKCKTTLPGLKISKNIENFVVRMPTVLYFGCGQVEKSLAKALKVNGAKRILMVYGKASIKKIGLYDKVVKILKENDFFVSELSGIQPNPTLKKVREGINLIKKEKINFILSVGGGSCIDACKAMARGVFSDIDIWKHFVTQSKAMQSDGKIKPVKVDKAVPLGTILTLSATGSEMNAGCVISNLETGEKLFCFDEKTKPKFSICDPTLTFSVPKYQTIAGCMDIFSHIKEAYFTSGNSPYLTQSIAVALMKTILHYLPIVLKEPNNYEARANIMWCSTVALNGMNAYGRSYKGHVGFHVHKLEHEVSAVYSDFTHGIGLAIIQLAWMRQLVKSLKGLKKEFALEKLCTFGRDVMGLNITKISPKNARLAIEALELYQKRNGIPIRMSNVLPDYDEKKAKECAESYLKHWDCSKMGWEAFNKDQILDIYMEAM